MFTGIIGSLGTVRTVSPLGDGHDLRLVIAVPWSDGPDRARRFHLDMLARYVARLSESR